MIIKNAQHRVQLLRAWLEQLEEGMTRRSVPPNTLDANDILKLVVSDLGPLLHSDYLPPSAELLQARINAWKQEQSD